MAMITLRKLWIHLIDTGIGLSFYTSFDRGISKSMQGEVRTYAGGRQRSVSAVGVKETLTLTLKNVDQTSIDTLETWFGQTVCVRDHRGRRWFGVFYALEIADRRKKTMHDVGITIYEVTYTEGS